MAIIPTPQGTLNRIRASVIFPLFGVLSVTSSFLGKRGISVTFTGKSTVFLDTMTGRVTSPEPYLAVTMTAEASQFTGNPFASKKTTLTRTATGQVYLVNVVDYKGIVVCHFILTDRDL